MQAALEPRRRVLGMAAWLLRSPLPMTPWEQEGLGEGGDVPREPGIAGGELEGLEGGRKEPRCCSCVAMVGVIPGHGKHPGLL